MPIIPEDRGYRRSFSDIYSLLHSVRSKPFHIEFDENLRRRMQDLTERNYIVADGGPAPEVMETALIDPADLEGRELRFTPIIDPSEALTDVISSEDTSMSLEEWNEKVDQILEETEKAYAPICDEDLPSTIEESIAFLENKRKEWLIKARQLSLNVS